MIHDPYWRNPLLDYDPENSKLCKSCNKYRPLEEMVITTSTNGLRYYRGICKACWSKYHMMYRKRRRKEEPKYEKELLKKRRAYGKKKRHEQRRGKNRTK